MKKKVLFLLCLILTLSMAACGSSGKEETKTETTAAASEIAETDEDIDEELETMESGETQAAPIEVADYDPDDYVTLAEYKGLEVDILSSAVADSDVEDQIEAELEENCTEEDRKDGAVDGDYITVTYDAKVDGETDEDLSSSDEIDICLGSQEFGENVDKALTGAKAGDEVTAKETMDETYGDDYDGKEVEYTFKVVRVYYSVTPELTEEYVKANTDSDSVEAYKAAVKARIEKENEEYNRSDAGLRAMSTIVENSTFKSYPQDLYDATYQQYDELYTYYAEGMFGVERSELVSDEDLAAEAENATYSTIAVNAIAKAEGLVLSDDDYQQYLKDNVESYGYDNVEDLTADYSEYELRSEAQQEKVISFILDNAKLNELTQEEYDAKYSDEEYDDSDSSGETLEEDEDVDLVVESDDFDEETDGFEEETGGLDEVMDESQAQ